MKRKVLIGISILASLQLVISCDKNDRDTPPVYTVPTTYTFDNVEYKEAGTRISMSLAVGSYIGKATSRDLSQDTVNNLWNNTNTSFTSEIVVNQPYNVADLNGLTYSLSSKLADGAIFKAFADSMVKMSQYRAAVGAQGVPGKVGNRLVNYRGLEFNQLVAKGLFGSLSLNNIVALLDKAATDDNTTVVPGTGTAMEHSWDLAFGYVGLPKNYDSSINYTQPPYSTNPERPLGIGVYFWERARPIKSGGIVFEAFRKGRAAIVAKDYVGRDAAAATIKEYLEKTLAAAAYAYLSLSKTRTTDADRFHDFSEATGFLLALKYRPTTLLSPQAYLELANILNIDFWTLSDASLLSGKVNDAQAKLTAAYGKLD